MANYGLLDTSIPGQAQNTLASAFKQTQDTLKAGRLSDLQFQQAERQGQVGDLQLQSAQRDAARDTQLDAYIKSPEVQALQQEPNKAAAYQKFMDGLMRNGGFQSPEMAMTYMKNRAEKEKPIPRPQHGMIDPNTFEVVVEPIPDKVETKFDANYPIGDNKVQPHYSRDQGITWQPVDGSKPSAKFAKQIPSSVVVGMKPNLGNINAALRRQDKELDPITKNQAARAQIEGLIGSASPATLPQIKAVLTNYLNTARVTNKQYGDQTSFGNIYQRSVNSLDRFINGDLTDANKQMILKMVRDMDSSVFEPARKNIVSRHKNVFEKLGVDPSLADNENPYASNVASPPETTATTPKYDAQKEARYQAWKAAQGK